MEGFTMKKKMLGLLISNGNGSNTSGGMQVHQTLVRFKYCTAKTETADEKTEDTSTEGSK